MNSQSNSGIVLLRTTLKCHRIAKELAADVGLSVNELHCLMQLHIEKPCCVRKLTDVLGLRGTSISKLLRSLEEHGYIERSLDAIDRRMERVTLTVDGVKVAEQVLTISEDFVSRIVEDLLPERRNAFLECLHIVSQSTETVREKEITACEVPEDN